MVVIFDTTVPISGPRPRRGIGPSSPCGEPSDSVSSPLAENFGGTRRKLFSEAYEHLDNEEGYIKTPVFNVPRHEGKSETKIATSSRIKSRPLPFNRSFAARELLQLHKPYQLVEEQYEVEDYVSLLGS